MSMKAEEAAVMLTVFSHNAAVLERGEFRQRREDGGDEEAVLEAGER